jgi:hypothetical protein
LTIKVLAALRSYGKRIEWRLYLIKWSVPRKKHDTEYTAHILLVKNPTNLHIAKISVASFLYHNPGSRVVIHCDQDTKCKAFKMFSFFIKKNSVQIVQLENQFGELQLQKIELLEIIYQHEKNFYMDYVLKWAGPLDLPEKCTFYISEFKLIDKSPFKELLLGINLKEEEIEMLNTAFVYLYPGNFDQKDLVQLREIYNKIENACNSGNVAKLDREVVMRLSEQIGFSIFLAKSGREHCPLITEGSRSDMNYLRPIVSI